MRDTVLVFVVKSRTFITTKNYGMISINKCEGREVIGDDILIGTEKPADWPANAQECELENLYTALKEFISNPTYKNKEVLVSLADNYDLNQKSLLGLHRNTAYEVSMINFLYLHALFMNFNGLKAYLYEHVGMVGRMQKMVSYMGLGEQVQIDTFKELLPSLKLYYICYLNYTIDKDMNFADKIVQIVEESLAENDYDNSFYLTHAYVEMLNDLSCFECTKRNRVWAFSRPELCKLFGLEARLTKNIGENPFERPLKGVLMITISNYILKSRYDYNSDYIAKYVAKEIALKSIYNHEIWIRKTERLNDCREAKVIPELFQDSSWLDYAWLSNVDFSSTRTYYVSSFCKNYNDSEMKKEYGDCVYGYKNDRLVELLAPIHLKYNDKKQSYPVFSQVIAFDVLYDREEAKSELKFLANIIDLFEMTDKEKKDFFEEIMQYWILSLKDPSWQHERERRYVIFMYDEYKYLEIDTSDKEFIKLKTSIFLLPDFVLGKNPAMFQIKASLENKRQAIAMKEYALCTNCLSADYDGFWDSRNKECAICGCTQIETISHNTLKKGQEYD